MGVRASQAAAPRAVAIYIRWSTDEQTDGTTLEVQRERCTLFIRSQGWEVVNDDLIFVDDGYSGGSLDRPALTRLRQAVRAGKVDCVVSYSVDRLSRNLADIVELVQKEWMGRATFRSASQPISTDEGNPSGQLVFNILASFAEFERGLIRERTHSGLVRRAQQGKYPGGRLAPMGYQRTGTGTLSIDSVAPDGTLTGPALVVKRIFGMSLIGPQGQGPTLIARQLNAEGVPGPLGGKWFAGVVRDILRNPVYAGTVVYGRRKLQAQALHDKSVPRLVKRAKPLVMTEDAVPAIVSKEDWERVQALEAERSKYTKKGVQNTNRTLLAGLLKCICGGPLHVTYKDDRRFYRCTRHALGGVCPFKPGHYRLEKIEETVISELKARYGNAELRERTLSAILSRSAVDDRRQVLLESATAVERRIKAVEAEVARLRKAARAGEIQLKTFEELRADADADLAELEGQKARLEQRVEEMKDVTASVEAWKQMVGGVELWDSLEQTRQREILFGLLRAVVVYRERGDRGPISIEIVWEEPLSGNREDGK
jgi:site-specific DNA recombinase